MDLLGTGDVSGDRDNVCDPAWFRRVVWADIGYWVRVGVIRTALDRFARDLLRKQIQVPSGHYEQNGETTLHDIWTSEKKKKTTQWEK